MKKSIENRKTIQIGTALLFITGMLVFNIVMQKWFFRIDLTSEKRYTISDDSKKILKNLDDVVFIKVYLDGDLSISMKQFQKSIVEMLDEFRIYGGKQIQYQVLDPFAGAEDEMREKIIKDLVSKGLKPMNDNFNKKVGTQTSMIVFPSAIIAYNGVEIPLNLHGENSWKSKEENLNNSIETLEYKFISTIKNITAKQINKIAIIEGHGEFPDIFMGDIMRELSKSFQIDRGVLHGKTWILDPYKVVIIAGPVIEFSEADKFVLDQYVMKGGKILWLLDGVNVDFDSLATGYSIAFPNNTNLDDMLFRYGVRINQVLIEDAQCHEIPVNVALNGQAANFQPFPWMYYPVIVPIENNLITQKTNLILTRFVSPIDTIEGRKEIVKKPLLVTSTICRIRKVPAYISLSEIAEKIDPKSFNIPQQLVGVLLEGKFESVFKNRILKSIVDSIPPRVLTESASTKMIVISDADVIRNEVKNTSKGPTYIPLGYDRFTGRTFGNTDFLINAISFLSGETDLLKLRGREFKIRLLNKKLLETTRLKWQIINLLLPVLLVATGGFVFIFIRRYKYTR